MWLSLVTGCVSISKQNLVGEYRGAPNENDGRSWSLDLDADDSFSALRSYKKAKPVPGTDEMEFGDLNYRGKWRFDHNEVILLRDDGAIEHLKIAVEFGVITLMPNRSDQPKLIWTKIPGYE
ncbi:MAG TPA: hypothetical protein VNV14_06315 [Opitutaceae bacterium]|nr:hypothetical protein [Opitutaceae bacterium]